MKKIGLLFVIMICISGVSAQMVPADFGLGVGYMVNSHSCTLNGQQTNFFSTGPGLIITSNADMGGIGLYTVGEFVYVTGLDMKSGTSASISIADAFDTKLFINMLFGLSGKFQISDSMGIRAAGGIDFNGMAFMGDLDVLLSYSLGLGADAAVLYAINDTIKVTGGVRVGYDLIGLINVISISDYSFGNAFTVTPRIGVEF